MKPLYYSSTGSQLFLMKRIGRLQIFNQHLIKDLLRLDLWDEDMRMEIIANKGSVKDIERIPQELRELYKTVWELPQRVIFCTIEQYTDEVVSVWKKKFLKILGKYRFQGGWI